MVIVSLLYTISAYESFCRNILFSDGRGKLYSSTSWKTDWCFITWQCDVLFKKSPISGKLLVSFYFWLIFRIS